MHSYTRQSKGPRSLHIFQKYLYFFEKTETDFDVPLSRSNIYCPCADHVTQTTPFPLKSITSSLMRVQTLSLSSLKKNSVPLLNQPLPSSYAFIKTIIQINHYLVRMRSLKRFSDQPLLSSYTFIKMFFRSTTTSFVSFH